MTIGSISSIGSVDHLAGIGRVLALRARILEQSPLGREIGISGTAAPNGLQTTKVDQVAGSGFGAALGQALATVNSLQAESGSAAASYERGENDDIASVMMARQKASIAFEATLQARNRLLSAYRDIMNMPV